MLVVADTSPINYLVLLEQTAVLPVLYTRVFLPPAVVTELQDLDGIGGAFVRVHPPTNHVQVGIDAVERCQPLPFVVPMPDPNCSHSG